MKKYRMVKPEVIFTFGSFLKIADLFKNKFKKKKAKIEVFHKKVLKNFKFYDVYEMKLVNSSPNQSQGKGRKILKLKDCRFYVEYEYDEYDDESNVYDVEAHDVETYEGPRQLPEGRKKENEEEEE